MLHTIAWKILKVSIFGCLKKPEVLQSSPHRNPILEIKTLLGRWRGGGIASKVYLFQSLLLFCCCCSKRPCWKELLSIWFAWQLDPKSSQVLRVRAGLVDPWFQYSLLLLDSSDTCSDVRRGSWVFSWLASWWLQLVDELPNFVQDLVGCEASC